MSEFCSRGGADLYSEIQKWFGRIEAFVGHMFNTDNKEIRGQVTLAIMQAFMEKYNMTIGMSDLIRAAEDEEEFRNMPQKVEGKHKKNSSSTGRSTRKARKKKQNQKELQKATTEEKTELRPQVIDTPGVGVPISSHKSNTDEKTESSDLRVTQKAGRKHAESVENNTVTTDDKETERNTKVVDAEQSNVQPLEMGSDKDVAPQPSEVDGVSAKQTNEVKPGIALTDVAVGNSIGEKVEDMNEPEKETASTEKQCEAMNNGNGSNEEKQATLLQVDHEALQPEAPSESQEKLQTCTTKEKSTMTNENELHKGGSSKYIILNYIILKRFSV